MFCNLTFKLRFSVLSFLTMFWALVGYSVNSCLSSPKAPKRVDNCCLDNFLDLLVVERSLSVGACPFLDPEMTEHRLPRKRFPSRLLTFRLTGFVAFLSSGAFACSRFFFAVPLIERLEQGRQENQHSRSLYIHGSNIPHKYGKNASLYRSFEES